MCKKYEPAPEPVICLSCQSNVAEEEAPSISKYKELILR